MQHIPLYLCKDKQEYTKILTELSEFRSDPSKKKICFLKSSIKPSLTPKLRIWKRICEFFYKPKHQRLSEVIKNTIRFLEANQKFINYEDNLTLVKIFRTKIFSIRNVHKKVDPSTFTLLNKIIDDQEKGLDAYLSAFQRGFQEKVSEMENSHKKLMEDLQSKIVIVQNNLDKTTLSVKEHNIQLQYLEYIETCNWSIACKFDKDQFENHLQAKGAHNLEIKFSNAKVTLHTAMVPEFSDIKFKKIEDGVKYSIPIEELVTCATIENVTKFVSLLYGAQGIQLTLQDFLIAIELAKKFQLSSLYHQLGKTFLDNVMNDPLLCMRALDNLQQVAKPNDPINGSFLILLALQVDRTVKGKIPKVMLDAIVNHLKEVQKTGISYSGKTIYDIIKHWESMGLI